MKDRSNLGRSNARNSARSRRRGNLLDLMDALGFDHEEQRGILARMKEGQAEAEYKRMAEVIEDLKAEGEA